MARPDGTIIIDTSVNTKGITAGTRKIQSQMKGLASTVKKIGTLVASAFAVREIVQFGKECLELGSDLAEVQNVVDVTFTTMSGKIDEFARSAAKNFGMSETMAKKYTGTFGSMAKAFNFSEQQAYDMSTALTGLTGDVASFYNISQDEAYTKLKSVFTGETESLKDLGVVMTQSALDAYALANGFGKTTKAMTEQEKVALRMSFVQNQLSAASGDFIRTSDSWANQVRIMQLQLQSLKATIGQGLINLFTPIIKLINIVLEKLATAANAFKSFTELITGNKAGPANGPDQTAGEYQNAAIAADGLADSTQDVTDATDKNTKALKKENQELKRGVASFDELNIMTQETADSIDGLNDGKNAGNSNVTAPVLGQTVDYGSLAKATEGTEKYTGVLDGVITKLKEVISVFRQAWAQEGKNTINAIKYAFSSLGKFIKSIGNSMWAVWTNGTGLQILTTVYQIVQGIFTTIGNIASKLNKAWNKNSVGTKIVQALANIIKSILGFINRIVQATAQWASGLEFYPLLEAIKNLAESLGPVIEKIGDFLYKIYTTIILPAAKYLIETALPAIINGLSGLFDFLAQHQWIIEAVGAALIGAFAAGKIVPLITPVIGAITAIVKALTGASGLTGAISMVVKAMGGPLTVAITAIIAIGALLISNWDSVCAAASKMKDWVVEKTRALKETVVEKFTNLGEKVSNVIQILRDSIKEKIDVIKEFFEGIGRWISETFVEGWKNAWEKVKEIFANVFNSFVDIAKKPINGVVKLLNFLIEKVESAQHWIADALSFSVDLPRPIEKLMGTDSFSMSVGKISLPRLPYLAEGTVVPRRAREFAAVLGDNNHETEVVSPLSTMKQAVLDALRESGASGADNQPTVINLNIDGQKVISWLVEQNQQFVSRTGRSLFEGA